MAWRERATRISRKAQLLFLRPWARSIGAHVTPVHFYHPIPDQKELPETLWTRPSELVGLDMNPEGQLQLLNELVTEYGEELGQIGGGAKKGSVREFYFNNGSFESVDAELLYGLIRRTKPRKVMEIGSGFSTLLTSKAIGRNRREDQVAVQFTAVEPYPRSWLRTSALEVTNLIEEPVQRVPMSVFEELEAGDVLFIDSSHVVKIGSDVQFLLLEVLPRLKKGVLIHLHDIFLPMEYPRHWVMDHDRFWTEQYLLHAFLLFNKEYEVVWAGSYMHTYHSDKLSKAFASYDAQKTLPGSFWIRRT